MINDIVLSSEHQPEEWVVDILSNLRNTDMKIILSYYEKIYPALLFGKFQDVNFLLFHINVIDCSKTFLVGLLRMTHPWKKNLSAWESLLERVVTKLEPNGLDSRSILEGLL